MKWMGKVIKLGGALLAVALAAVAGGASAQMYTWKDAKGVTHFSDQPPPEAAGAKAGAVATKAAPRGPSQPSLPYALAEAVKRNPVVLYTTGQCAACDQGRALLQQRGVPYLEKTVNSNEDQQQLKAAGSDLRLPLLLVGSNKQLGFEAVGWQEALTAASYPLQSRLPAGWRQAPPVAAAPLPAAKSGELARQVVTDKPEVMPVKPPPENAPPGFQF